MSKSIQKCEVPDVAEFLKLSRSLIRQANLIKNMDVSKEHQSIINKASMRVLKELNLNALKGNISHGPM